MTNQSAGARAWCFTLNNPAAPLSFDGQECVRYAIWQKESGENHTPHYQGYIELTRPQRLSWLQALIPGAHFERRRGTRDQARDYARKEDTRLEGPWEYGTWAGGQGRRSDIHDACQVILSGGSLKRVATEHPAAFVRYHKGFSELARIQRPLITVPRYRLDQFLPDPIPLDAMKVLCHYLCGPTGCGKTQFALAHFKSPLYVQHVDDLRGLDPDVHDGIVFDDMDFTHWPATSVIHLLDLETPSVIHCRYSNAIIPSGFPRLFTGNVDNPFYKGMETHQWHQEAINRRFTRLNYSEKMYSNNVQVIDLDRN